MIQEFKRNVYLTTIPIPEAVERVRGAINRETLIREVPVPTHEAAGYVTSRAVIARFSSPTFHSAAMDGYAVKAEETFSAREGHPVLLPKDKVKAVNTGNPMPEWADAVVMIENVTEETDGISLVTPVFPWQNVRRIGEDIVATELLIPRNRRLNAYDVGALLTAGIFEVMVWEQVRIVAIPTGDEILDFRTRPVPAAGQVVDSNSQVLTALAKDWGCDVHSVPPVPDNPDRLREAVGTALDSGAHVVVIGAGSSAGTKDYTRSIMEHFGTVLVHGVKAMPGKPSLLGVTHDGRIMVGAPGYPVSAVICYEELLKPLVMWLGRRINEPRRSVEVELARKAPSKLGMEEFVRVAIGRVGEKWVASPLPRGAGMITTMTKAQGIVRIPAEAEGLEAGRPCRAELLVPVEELNRILVTVGSHDNILDLLADELMGLPEPIGLTSNHVGSMGGLTALRGGSAHFAGTHLFDPDTGDFNFPFLDKHLPGQDIVLVNLAIRHQGLIVAKGNPKAIEGVNDLGREDILFINRQRGAGTRILLDYHLKTAGITPDRVRGYDKEEFTHMAVAVNVLSGTADCGLGIYTAAKALGLDFLPLARERYDLAMPASMLDDPRMAVLLEMIRSRTFQDKVAALGGYEVTLTGRVMRPGQGLNE